MAWSNERVMPKGWKAIRKQVATRASGQCEQVEQGQRCPLPGTDCDHIGDREDHSLDNLQWLCSGHHDEKTRAQAHEAQRARNRKLKHPSAHALPPGLR